MAYEISNNDLIISISNVRIMFIKYFRSKVIEIFNLLYMHNSIVSGKIQNVKPSQVQY